MLDGEVKKISDDFVSFWNEVFQAQPQFLLDYTWPSIGIVDKLLFPLRGKKTFSAADLPLIRGAAAYIGIIAFRAWRNFPEVETSLTLTLEEPRDIVIKAKGGKFLKDDENFGISIGRTIENALKQVGTPVEIFADFTRVFSRNENILSNLATGIVSGACPSGHGPWKEKSQEKFNEYLVRAAEVMSDSCIEFNDTHYSGVAEGSRKELYFPNLLLPPIGFNEPHPGSRAMLSILGFKDHVEMSEEQLTVLAKNLAHSPDEHISTAGFIVASALCQNEAPNWLRAYGLVHAERLPRLRPVVDLAKSYLKQPRFFQHFEKGESEIAKASFKIEYEIGFFPLYFLPHLNYLENPNLNDFFYLLSWTSPRDCYNALDTYSILEPHPLDLQLQLLFLKICSGDTDSLDDRLNKIEGDLDPSDSELIFRFFELRGMSSELKGRPQDAFADFEQALLAKTTDDRRFATVATKVSRIYISDKKFDQALVLLNQVIERAPYWIPARLLRQAALLNSGDNDQFELSLLESLNYCNFSNHLFSFLKGNLIQKLSTQASEQG
jgi:hypothetical protein